MPLEDPITSDLVYRVAAAWTNSPVPSTQSLGRARRVLKLLAGGEEPPPPSAPVHPDLTRVYIETGTVAHLAKNSNAVSTLCGMWSPYSLFRGTGTQQEYEIAARLPVCQRCAAKTVI